MNRKTVTVRNFFELRLIDFRFTETPVNQFYTPPNNTWLSKERAKAFHDKHINRKEFSTGQRVLLNDSRLHLFPRYIHTMLLRLRIPQRLHLKWRDICHTFKLNRHGLKHFLEMLSEEAVECHLPHEPPLQNILHPSTLSPLQLTDIWGDLFNNEIWSYAPCLTSVRTIKPAKLAN